MSDSPQVPSLGKLDSSFSESSGLLYKEEAQFAGGPLGLRPEDYGSLLKFFPLCDASSHSTEGEVKEGRQDWLLAVKETVIVFTQLMQHTRAGLGLEIFLGCLIRRGFLYSDFSKLKTTALYSDVNV